jgi:hypothetical protein
MKFQKEVSGGIVTIKPEGKIFYSLEEGDSMKKEIERLKEAGDALAATGGQHGFDEALDNWKAIRSE